MDVIMSRFFFFSSRRRHTRLVSDWSSDVCSSDLIDETLTIPGSTSPGIVVRFTTANQVVSFEALNAQLSLAGQTLTEIGRASCRERVEISVGAGALQKNSTRRHHHRETQ